MIAVVLVAALVVGPPVTWGFPVYAYGRWQRVVGFPSYARCMEISAALRESQPLWVVGETCVPDVARRVPPEKP